MKVYNTDGEWASAGSSGRSGRSGSGSLLDAGGPVRVQFTAVVYLVPPRPGLPEALDAVFRDMSVPFGIQVVDKRRGLLATPGRYEFSLAPDRATYSERFGGRAFDVDVVKDGLLQFLSIIRKILSPDSMAFPQLSWVAHWGCAPDRSALDYLNQTFKLMAAVNLDHIGNRIASCVRLVSLDSEEPIDVRLEPLFEDLNKLFMQVSTEYPAARIQGYDLTQLSDAFRKSHEALHAVTRMLQDRMPPNVEEEPKNAS